MKSMNRVFIMGNLGHAPELTESKNGRPYTLLRVATQKSRPRDDGGYEEIPEWHSIFVWGKLAETCARNLRKGALVFVEGSLSYWQDSGGKIYKSAITAENVHFLNIRKVSEEQTTGIHLDNPGSARNHDAVAHLG